MNGGQKQTVAAVIVHWGPALPSIELAGWLARCPSINEVIVVANNQMSCPDGIEPSIRWLVPSRNLGFARAFDTAVCEYPGHDVYLLLNNDVQLSRTTIDACLALLSAENVGVVAPALYNNLGLQSGAGTVSRFVMEPRVRGEGTGARDTVWVTGAVMFIRAACYKEIRFDQRFFLGGEDVDFCLRLRSAGWRVLVTFADPARHRGGSTIPSNGFQYYAIRNRLWLVRRHGGGYRYVAAVCRVAGFLLARTLVADLLKRRGLIRTKLVFHGLIDGVRPMPTLNEPRPDEPRPSLWLDWR
ncbi:glycosyltransferases-like protein [Candidatus Protofrankia californiensis]|uniref:Glycosyltransferases-like protein n=1 Tax=Candidatus Protofrankia californiensis TaxID=1839754 RepID=A0A1C3NXP3_9ACTN|nr:glycosyltransferases-like protein [Candidatus Protofrankia californiensis]